MKLYCTGKFLHWLLKLKHLKVTFNKFTNNLEDRGWIDYFSHFCFDFSKASTVSSPISISNLNFYEAFSTFWKILTISLMTTLPHLQSLMPGNCLFKFLLLGLIFFAFLFHLYFFYLFVLCFYYYSLLFIIPFFTSLKFNQMFKTGNF